LGVERGRGRTKKGTGGWVFSKAGGQEIPFKTGTCKLKQKTKQKKQRKQGTVSLGGGKKKGKHEGTGSKKKESRK